MGGDFFSKRERQLVKPPIDKPQLLYCNFSVTTHPDRIIAKNMLESLPFATMRHMGTFMDYPMSRVCFFEELWAHKYAACPRGNAVDTFRFWDTLVGGSVPIVVVEHLCDDFYNLPLVKLPNVESYASLSIGWLEREYTHLLDCTFNFDMLTSGYWEHIVASSHLGA